MRLSRNINLYAKSVVLIEKKKLNWIEFLKLKKGAGSGGRDLVGEFTVGTETMMLL